MLPRRAMAMAADGRSSPQVLQNLLTAALKPAYSVGAAPSAAVPTGLALPTPRTGALLHFVSNQKQ